MHRTTPVFVAAVVAVAGAITAAPVAASDADAKVTTGRPADVGEYPWQVALLLPDQPDNFQAQFCGGTLIHPSWVLTAAHCVSNFPADVHPDVLVGTTRLDGSGERIPGDAHAMHPQFAFPRNDVALVRLSRPATTPTAFLAYEGMEQLEAAGTPAVVTGWGSLDNENTQFPTDLQEGDVPVISDEQCNAELARYEDALADPAGQVCAGSGTADSQTADTDACQGDSGGPLWAVGPDGVRRQIGIVGGGPTCGFSPTYYTSVETFIGYAETVTGLQFASFLDIPGDAHEQNVERIILNAFASGVGAGRYEPGGPVSRGQMATFLARALHLAPVENGPFSDVDGTPHEGSINAVAQAGIAGGFSDGTYKPAELVTRDQMATFLARALQLQPVATGPFTDTGGNAHEQNINAVAQAGVAGGFPDGTYRPRNGVTRGQMATFLAKAFVS